MTETFLNPRIQSGGFGSGSGRIRTFLVRYGTGRGKLDPDLELEDENCEYGSVHRKTCSTVLLTYKLLNIFLSHFWAKTPDEKSLYKIYRAGPGSGSGRFDKSDLDLQHRILRRKYVFNLLLLIDENKIFCWEYDFTGSEDSVARVRYFFS
jgi:hypothetical protein